MLVYLIAIGPNLLISFSLVAMWSKDFPPSASCLSPLPGFESRRAYEKGASDLGLGGGSR